MMSSGLSDLGSVVIKDMGLMKTVDVPNKLVDFSKDAASYGYQIIKRFPLRKEFIRDEKYSKKFRASF